MKRARSAGSTSTTLSSAEAPLAKVPRSDGGSPEAVVDSESALRYLQSLCHPEVFGGDPPLPPIVLKHQLYSLLHDRTAVDRELASLRDNGCIRIFKLGVSEHHYALVQEEKYCSYLQEFLKNDSSLCRKVTQAVLPECREVSVTQQQLAGDRALQENQLSVLVRRGVLLPKDVGKSNRSWWFGIPGLSPYMKSLVKGRASIQQSVNRSKFSEILECELKSRKFKVSKLSVEYHIHDLIGSDQLERVPTTSGPLLRAVQASK